MEPRIEQVFGAGGRARVLAVMLEKGELNISQLVSLSSLEHGSVEKHMRYLCGLGLAREKRYGRIRIYALEERNPYVVVLHRFANEWKELAALAASPA
ncbi:MAG: helix-turn-helix transcriptional regulator [Nitrososphaerota archaeon]|nr:helix-turn-helix transcriptional regulator [Nitrososphaerota archaeon]MDG6939572.1 helix-turn-helix transcriptional regulator [Nitrososphaerota archaeon]